MGAENLNCLNRKEIKGLGDSLLVGLEWDITKFIEAIPKLFYLNGQGCNCCFQEATIKGNRRFQKGLNKGVP